MAGLYFGYLTTKELAEAIPRHLGTLYNDLRDPDCPKIVPDMKIGASNLYAPETVAEFLPLYRQWLENMPRRIKARQERIDREWAAKCEKSMAQWAEVKPQKATV